MFTAPTAEKVGLARIIWVTVAELAKFLIRRIAPLATVSDSGADIPGTIRQSTATNCIAETEALAALAAAHGARVNDILMRDLFQVVAQWNSRCGKLRPSQWLVVNMPKNMREAGMRRCPPPTV